jgi:hypothetical protein
MKAALKDELEAAFREVLKNGSRGKMANRRGRLKA